MNVIMKSRMRERRTYGSVRGLWREPLVYSTVELRKSKLEVYYEYRILVMYNFGYTICN